MHLVHRTTCHEHLEYYSPAVIEYILGAAGVKVFNVATNDINGGSLRCYATPADNFSFRREEFMQNIRAESGLLPGVALALQGGVLPPRERDARARHRFDLPAAE